MPPMTPEQKEKFRSLLQQEHDAISTEVRAHARAGAATADEVESAIVESDENLLEKIEFALRRLEDGTYGTCAQCGGAIPAERLEAKPAVSLCTPCQEEKERRA